MTEGINIKEVHAGFRELFKEAFVTNCLLDDSSVTSEEIATLEELDIQELLVNFKDLIHNLLTFKKTYKHTETATLVQQVQEFESLLQKAEAEIRSHIGIEHQLKLHIDLTQAQLDELSKKSSEAKPPARFSRKNQENLPAKSPFLAKKNEDTVKSRKPTDHDKKRRKSSRQSMGEADLNKVNKPPKPRPVSRGHIRSVSEQLKQSHQRAPSR